MLRVDLLPGDSRTTENPTLRRLLEERTAAGPITFHDFMAAALYEPRHGYYNSRRLKLGREGDFLTSPEVHPAFGACLARAVVGAWEALDRPEPLVVIEPGPGSGALAADLLQALTAAGVPRIDYRLVEISPALRQQQQERLEDWTESVSWTAWEDLRHPVPAAVVVSNELFDSLPVHRVRMSNGRLEELFVTTADGAFVASTGPLSTPELECYFQRLGLYPGEGCTAEVNLEAPVTMRLLAGAFTRGAVFTFDYGYEAGELYAPWRRDGTLLCYYRHASDTDPLVRVGRQDITSHVDFTTLKQAGEEAGLETVALVSQAEFLAALGLGDLLSGEVRGTELEEFYARRRAVGQLLDPGGLGRVRALVQCRGAELPRALAALIPGGMRA